MVLEELEEELEEVGEVIAAEVKSAPVDCAYADFFSSVWEPEGCEELEGCEGEPPERKEGCEDACGDGCEE